MPPVIGLAGPTAAGKTALAVELALRVGGEVVSADSVQVYRGFDAGSGKPTAAERRGVPHHLLDVADPDDPMTAARWRRLAEEAVGAILGRGRVPIVCGGTGLYFTVLQRGLAPLPPPDPARRADLAALPPPALRRRLEALDPVAAAAIDPRNPRRLARAIEIVEATGLPLAAARRGGTPAPFPFRVFRLEVEPAALAARIERRVRGFFAAGLVEEARGLLERWGDCEPLRSVGYREAVAHIRGRLGLDEAIREAVAATRRLARRQRTWLRRQVEATPVDGASFLAEAARLLVP